MRSKTGAPEEGVRAGTQGASWYRRSPEQVLEALDTDRNGLDDDEADRRRAEQAAGMSRDELERQYPLRHKVPFRTEQKYMATIHDEAASDRGPLDNPGGFVLVGMQGLLDPPRESAVEAVAPLSGGATFFLFSTGAADVALAFEPGERALTQRLLRFEPLDLATWAVAAAVASTAIVVNELHKRLRPATRRPSDQEAAPGGRT